MSEEGKLTESSESQSREIRPANDSELDIFLSDADARLILFLREHDERFREIEEESVELFKKEPVAVLITRRSIDAYKRRIDTSLTFSTNREHFMEEAQKKTEEWRSEGKGNPWAVILDVDGLKDVNREHGYSGGDLLILTLAEAGREVVEGNPKENIESAGEGFLFARYGGDEFTILIPPDKSEEEVKGFIMKVRDRHNKYLENSFPESDLELELGFSGIYTRM